MLFTSPKKCVVKTLYRSLITSYDVHYSHSSIKFIDTKNNGIQEFERNFFFRTRHEIGAFVQHKFSIHSQAVHTRLGRKFAKFFRLMVTIRRIKQNVCVFGRWNLHLQFKISFIEIGHELHKICVLEMDRKNLSGILDISYVLLIGH